MFALSAILVGVVGILFVRRRGPASAPTSRRAVVQRVPQKPAVTVRDCGARGTDRPPTRGSLGAGDPDSPRHVSPETAYHLRGARGLWPPSVASIQRFGKKMSPVR